jgi:hypothetical protein
MTTEAAKPEVWAMQPSVYRLLVVLIYFGATILVLVPAFFLYSGIHELGGDMGWWPGSPNENDGPQFALVLGGVPIVLILGLVAAAIVALARRVGRAGWPAALLGSLWLLLVVTVSVAWVLTDSISRLSTP